MMRVALTCLTAVVVVVALLLWTEPWVALLAVAFFLAAGFFMIPISHRKSEGARENDDSQLFIDVGAGPGP